MAVAALISLIYRYIRPTSLSVVVLYKVLCCKVAFTDLNTSLAKWRFLKCHSLTRNCFLIFSARPKGRIRSLVSLFVLTTFILPLWPKNVLNIFDRFGAFLSGSFLRKHFCRDFRNCHNFLLPFKCKKVYD